MKENNDEKLNNGGSMPEPELSERVNRCEKVKILRQKGVNPYPAESQRTHTIREVVDLFENLQESKTVLTIAGRVMAKREHGGSTFVDIHDGADHIQCYFKKDALSSKNVLTYEDFLSLVDCGDFIEATGTVFLTKKGEKTLLVEKWGILTKSLLPLPKVWFGIRDQEKRYRQRYLDILLDPEIKELFLRKAIFWNSVRDFLLQKGFVEVYTPVLENTTGGADARPFQTFHNALQIPVYLRISMGELWQKKLMVAGFPKTFEIGRQFRNEGIDPEHLQDYTQMEFYLAYADYRQGMALTTDLIRDVAQKTFGTLEFHSNNFHINLANDWGVIDYEEEIQRQLGINIFNASLGDFKAKLEVLGIEYDQSAEKGRLMDLLWKHCRKSLQGPVYLTNIPVDVSPLAKRHEDNPQKTQRFQLIIAGSELCNGYSELNDPQDQRERFCEQAKMREVGDEEAQMFDEEFVEALEYGMPPVCGMGFSERLFAFLEGKSVRECVMFPFLRPKEARKEQQLKDELHDS